jgi:hypothetical protein
MRSTARLLCVAAVCISTATLGCGSSLKGKIEGKWKVVSVEGEDLTKDMPAKLDLYLYYDFRPDGVLAMGAGSSDPQAADFIKMMMEKAPSCKYKILSGDEVEVSDIPKDMHKTPGGPFAGKDRGKAKVTITGDDMTLTPEEGKTIKLTRIK